LKRVGGRELLLFLITVFTLYFMFTDDRDTILDDHKKTVVVSILLSLKKLSNWILTCTNLARNPLPLLL
jgi:hypothetical protein